MYTLFNKLFALPAFRNFSLKTFRRTPHFVLTMNPLLGNNSQAMMGFQHHYGNMNAGNYSQMNVLPNSAQRSSFAIHEILGLNSPPCRQNPSPDILDNLGICSSNSMYHSGVNGTGMNPVYAAEPQHPNYFRDVPQSQNNTFCPWRFDSVNQTTPNCLPSIPSNVSRCQETVGYGLKAPSEESKGHCNIISILKHTDFFKFSV